MISVQSEKGSMALDFIFAFTLIFGFVTLMFSLALTLSAVEMTQYMTFSAARKYHQAHVTPERQSESALRKYQSILESPAYSFIRRGTWFEVFENPLIGNASDNEQLRGYNQGGQPNLFNGVVTLFTAKILGMNIGSFGSTLPDNDSGDGSSFFTHIGSYVGREPSSQECLEFNKERWRAIRNLVVQAGATPYTTGTDENAYFPMSDNGC